MSQTVFRLSTIELVELADRLADRARPQVWNVLTDDGFDDRMIPGSRRVPLDRVVRSASEENLPHDIELVVYGSGPGCPQSRLAAEKLAAAGYRGVRCFEGGLARWQASGHPLAQPEAAAA
jgi:rhodanese-related sulfurtransferase